MLNKKALAGTAGAAKEYVEDVFSTYLYTGNGATGQTITNGIDLSGEGGLVWMKGRSGTSDEHVLVDTVRGDNKALSTINTTAEVTETGFGSFLSDGFSLSSGGSYYNLNISGRTFVSWTFRKAKKFFDIVTYTGNGSSSRTVTHNLGSVPGMIIVKRTDSIEDWFVYHRSITASGGINLNTTDAKNDPNSTFWNSTEPTSTVFTVGNNGGVNANGGTYVAYLFAHDAGGFGAAGTDNVISCGSYTLSGSATADINLGYEPQIVISKAINTTGNWVIQDNMRGMTDNSRAYLFANNADAETSTSSFSLIIPTATGFRSTNQGSNGNQFIYMAIRRPMKTPTSGTEVFAPVQQGFDGFVNTGFVTDLIFGDQFTGGNSWRWLDRLRGGNKSLNSDNTGDEGTEAFWKFDYNNGVNLTYGGTIPNWIWYNFRRATGFFDVVCYTGTGANRTVTHNLGVTPELMIVKSRNGGAGREWIIYASGLGNTKALQFNTYGPSTDIGYWNNTTPNSSTFTLGTEPFSNTSGEKYVAYLFASVAGVSKIGSYTGNGSNQTINCGFTAGARFVLIRRSDSGGDWVVLNTVRGIVSGNDPFLQLNNSAAEVTGQDVLDPDNSGFIVNETTENLNVNNATYIYLAIA